MTTVLEMESEKKISFGFSKISKKPALLLNKPFEGKKIELIECLVDQSIKVIDEVEVVTEPLVIPIKGSKEGLVDRIRDAAKSREKIDIKNEVDDTRPDSELTIDELAARELVKDAQNRLLNLQSDNKVFVIPKKEDKSEFDGESEPTLEDYDKVPINDFGLAMLRGMGWKEDSGIGRNPTKASLMGAPELRPKGLGLGANKLVKTGTSKGNMDTDGKDFILIKGAFVKIIAGTHKNQYGEVLGLDDEAARVIIKTATKGEILTLNEFLVTAVTTEEYSKYSKVLNTAKYEEYKEKEKEASDNNKNNSGKPEKSRSKRNYKKVSSSSYSSSQNNEGQKPETHERTNMSGSRYLEKHEQAYERSSKKHYSSDSSSLENEKLSSKVHKRKDKRRHRDKSRSPHRKHNKYGNNRKFSKSKYRSSSSSDSEHDKRKKDKKYISSSRNSSSDSECEKRERTWHRKEDRSTKHSRC